MALKGEILKDYQKNVCYASGFVYTNELSQINKKTGIYPNHQKEKKNGVEVSQKRLRKIILKYLNDIENLVQF